MTRPIALLPAVLAMAAVVTASNILVQFRLGDHLTWGALTYPFAFLVTDITNRVAGPAAARRVVVAGFWVGVLCSLAAAALDKTTLRIAIASGTAFLAAQTLDISVFNRLRAGSWWRAPLVSTLFSSTLDTMIFFSLAFAAAFRAIDPADDVSWAAEQVPLWFGHGPLVPLWAALGAADWTVKLGLAALALIPFRIIVGNLLRARAESR
ncbi:VUT family protein [Paracoccus suum]|uniref:Probable queuosine precursor transporter n=1 Tax=Paracoccus suum TaxID=2259340 RepID=A0A344PIG5_9RHOB|nr:queuosine precursor transporter [Paracoccus suum]AXC49170.1 VUT family protein [Paracoccus suum]